MAQPDFDNKELSLVRRSVAKTKNGVPWNKGQIDSAVEAANAHFDQTEQGLKTKMNVAAGITISPTDADMIIAEVARIRTKRIRGN